MQHLFPIRSEQRLQEEAGAEGRGRPLPSGRCPADNDLWSMTDGLWSFNIGWHCGGMGDFQCVNF